MLVRRQRAGRLGSALAEAAPAASRRGAGAARGRAAFRSDRGRTQLQAALAGGDVFVVADGERAIVAVDDRAGADGRPRLLRPEELPRGAGEPTKPKRTGGKAADEASASRSSASSPARGTRRATGARSAGRRERLDVYFDDGSFVTYVDGSTEADRLLPLARDVLAAAREP